MLLNNDTSSIKITIIDGKTHIETKFFDIIIEEKISIIGQKELWVRIESRAAFEIACLRKEGDKIFVTLCKKRRLATDKLRTKVPGEYLWSETTMVNKILTDVGIQIYPEKLSSAGICFGHSEIYTPIYLYYTFDWMKMVDNPREEIEVFEMDLEEAFDLAIKSDGNAPGFENVSSKELIMALYGVWKSNRL